MMFTSHILRETLHRFQDLHKPDGQVSCADPNGAEHRFVEEHIEHEQIIILIIHMRYHQASVQFCCRRMGGVLLIPQKNTQPKTGPLDTKVMTADLICLLIGNNTLLA